MDKYISLLLIIIIVYVTYVYCTHQTNKIIEGVDVYDETQDTAVVAAQCSGKAATSIDTTTNATSPCQFKGSSCVTMMENANKEKWANHYTDYSAGDYSDDKGGAHAPGWILKSQCAKCVQGSEMDGTMRRWLSNVQTTPTNQSDPPTSRFAYDVCDAMAAECTDPLVYANNRQDWDKGDCSTVSVGSTNPNLNILLCQLTTNAFIQFFLGFMGGATCTLKIKALELKASLLSGLHKLERIPHDIACSICKGPVPCPDGC
jgi:hypothetical protein